MVQRAEAIAADGEGHRAERAERRGLHDDAHDAEEDFRRRHSMPSMHGAAALAESGDGEGGEHGDEQDLQQIAGGEGV